MKRLKSLPRSKRIFPSGLIAVLLVLLVYVILNIAFWYKGMPERFFKYRILENDTVGIEYYNGPFVMLNIPDTLEGKPVTSIDAHLMEEHIYKNGKITGNRHSPLKHFIFAVHLPDTVEELHFDAFGDCDNLRTINIPANLKFAGCRILAGTKVKKLVFPEGITEIGCGYDVDLDMGCRESFAEMEYLCEVDFPASLKKIGNNVFADCKNLKKAELPDGIDEIGYGAFRNSGLTEANIPKSLTNNGGCIFIGTPFEDKLAEESEGDFIIFNDVLLYKYIGNDENPVIPDGIESICNRAFWDSPNVKNVDIPESVRYINNAFEFSNVESLVIPNTVAPDNSMSFYGCSKLKNIILPDRIKEISEHAFEKCKALESIDIPESVKYIGDYAFGECSSLKEVNIEGNPQIGENAFESCNAKLNYR